MTYKSGSHYVKVLKGDKEYSSAKITVSRSSAPDWDTMRGERTEWTIASNNDKIAPAESTVATVKSGHWPEGYILSDDYPDKTFQSSENVYAFLFYDLNVKIPKGWKYDCPQIYTEAGNSANYIGLAESAGKANSKDRTVSGKYHINVAVTSLRTLNKVRYTGSEYHIILKPNKCTVSFDPNGGKGSMTSQSVTYETETQLTPCQFSRQGYKLSGWNTKKDGSGDSYEDEATVTKAFPEESKVTLYAQWKEIKVKTVEFKPGQLEMVQGERKQLTPVITPDNALDKSLTWSSSKKKVVTVDAGGVVKAKKQGTAVITAKSSNGITGSCQIKVRVQTPQAADAKKKKKKGITLTGTVSSATSVVLKVENGAKSLKNCYIMIGGKKCKLSRYSVKLDGKKLKKNQFTLKKHKTYTITVSKLKKTGNYLFQVGKKGHLSNKFTMSSRVPELEVVRKGNSLVLKWNKMKKSTGYKIYRAESASGVKKAKKAYKTINEEKTAAFSDSNVKPGVVYHYAVQAKNSRERSEVASGALIDVAKNLAFARNSPLFTNITINDDPSWNANSFRLPNGSLPPLKYRFTGRVLEIHLYLDFVKYTLAESVNNEGKARVNFTREVNDKIGGELYTDRFLRGLKKGYSGLQIVPGKGDFGGQVITFDTKLVVHLYGKEQYQPGQRFTQIRIGGESPHKVDGNTGSDFVYFDDLGYWYHASLWTPNDWEVWYPYIHMPVIEQLDERYKQYCSDVAIYMSTVVHEMGHVLGLDDAYTEENDSDIVILDRCADNKETCLKKKEDDVFEYYNLMKGNLLSDVSIRANDVEMMLNAYSLSENGIPFETLQSYKDYNWQDNDHTISQVIRNRNDENNEIGQLKW